MLVLSILLKKKKLATLADKIAEVISVVFNAALIQLKWVFDNLIGYKTAYSLQNIPVINQLLKLCVHFLW